jgi:hypothetical protein
MSGPRLDDREVGTTHEDGRAVFQCARTGLLYCWADPPKRYVSTFNVRLASPRDAKEKSHARSRAPA